MANQQNFLCKASETGDRYGDKFVKVTVCATPFKIAELWRVSAANSYTEACVRYINSHGQACGPFLLGAYPDDYNEYQPHRPTTNWDMSPATAAAIGEIIAQRKALIDAAQVVIAEVNSAGYLNRGEDCVLALEALVGSLL